ncbi:MAG: filamentous hemagglutinin N-terminal domain-containing protein, partial [Zoogloeaceae bacterium]|nr:filamentous hemagglutinin N-terminal domain-containing protein [Zoogloeaceae bacterium]
MRGLSCAYRGVFLPRGRGLRCRAISLTVALSLFFEPLLPGIGVALAGEAGKIEVDGRAGGGTTVTAAANGIPVVHIARPNGKGLSHNTFIAFHTGKEGLILNNAGQAVVSTRLGGQILGNPNVAGGAAKVILNEVTGNHASSLAGYIEVAGGKAHVIVANPQGITCNGCGFLNTPRVTLTTGKPVLSDGALHHYEVEKGRIVLEGADLDAGEIGRFELIARSVELNAALHARDLSVVAGKNDVDADTLGARARAADESERPLLAIDSTALGGMYADTIRLVGTEAGVGVRLLGNAAASAGDIALSADGKLTLARAAASRDLVLRAQDMDLSADVYAGRAALLESGDGILLDGTLAAGESVALMGKTLINRGTLGAGVDTAVSVSELVNEGGLIFSGGKMALFADAVRNRQGEIASLGALVIARDAAGGMLDVLENRSGRIEAANDLLIAAAEVSNARQTLEASQEKIAARLIFKGCSGSSDCGGTNRADNYILEEVDRLMVTEASAPSWIVAGGNVTLTGRTLVNDASVIRAGKDLRIRSEVFANRGILTGEILTRRWLHTHLVKKSGVRRIRREADRFSARNWPTAESDVAAQIGAFISANIDLPYTRVIEDRYLPAEDRVQYLPLEGDTAYEGVVEAGGGVTIDAERVEQDVRKPGFFFVNGGQTTVGGERTGGAGGEISLSVRPLADMERQMIDPLSLPGFVLPGDSGGIFARARPERNYLIETNPVFANFAEFVNSDYLLTRLGYDPDEAQKRLGDGGYEQRLVREALYARTGAYGLAGYDDAALYRALMDRAAEAAADLGLSVGVALTAEQIAALRRDIVWLVEREAGGERVLAPTLYLARAEALSGARIAGAQADLRAREIQNEGRIAAKEDVRLDVAGLLENQGQIAAGEALSARAGFLYNRGGGLLRGEDVDLAAAGDLVNERSVITHRSAGGEGGAENGWAETRWGKAAREISTRTDFVDSAARIEAGNSLRIQTGGDLVNSGGEIVSGGSAALIAGGDLVFAARMAEQSAEERVVRGASVSRYSREETGKAYAATATAGGDLTLLAGGNAVMAGSQARAAGDVLLAAGGEVALLSAEEWRHFESHKKTGSTRDVVSTRTRQRGTEISGENVALLAGGNLIARASSVRAERDLFADAGGDMALLSAGEREYFYRYKERDGTFGKKTRRDMVLDERAAGSVFSAGQDLTLESGGDQRYQAADLAAGRETVLRSGGRIDFEGVKEAHQESHEKSESGMLWQSAAGKGVTDETLRQSRILAEGVLRIEAADGIRVDVREVNAQTVSQVIQAMADADAGLAWIRRLDEQGGVDWRQVKEIHDRWQYSHEGLSGVAALVVAVVATVLTYGAASAAVASAAGTTAATASATTAAAAGAAGAASAGSAFAAGGWANAALAASLSSMTGNAAAQVGATGEIKGGSLLKSGFAALLTASLLNYPAFAGEVSVNQMAGLQTSPVVKAAGGFRGDWAQIYGIAGRGVIGAGVASAVHGTDFWEEWIGGVAGDLAALSANEIGAAWGGGKNPAMQTAAHAGLGAAAAWATGRDPAAGAIGGLAESILDNSYGQYLRETNRQTSDLGYVVGAMLAAGMLSQAAGRDPAAAAQTAQNAAIHNYLTTKESRAFDEELSECKASGGECGAVVEK